MSLIYQNKILISINKLIGGIKMKKILTYGTFDLLHYGHINLLKRARALGDHLTVGLSTDEFNAIKNKKSFYTYEVRKLMLESLRCVDLVIPERNWEQKIEDIQKYEIDMLIMGSDWEGNEKFMQLQKYCKVYFLPRTESISSTKIKEQLKLQTNQIYDFQNIKKNKIKRKEDFSLCRFKS